LRKVIVGGTPSLAAGRLISCFSVDLRTFRAKPITSPGLCRAIWDGPRPYWGQMEDHDGEMPVFDRTGLLETVGGDEDVLKELVQLFLEEMPHEIEAFAGTITRGDLPAASRMAHKLKGTSRNMRAIAIGEAFAQLEEVIKAGDEGEIKNLLSRVKVGFSEFKQACLRTICETSAQRSFEIAT
jgi:HPt (histidine-containing phosphotransfer) domain-containing protein